MNAGSNSLQTLQAVNFNAENCQRYCFINTILRQMQSLSKVLNIRYCFLNNLRVHENLTDNHR